MCVLIQFSFKLNITDITLTAPFSVTWVAVPGVSAMRITTRAGIRLGS